MEKQRMRTQVAARMSLESSDSTAGEELIFLFPPSLSAWGFPASHSQEFIITNAQHFSMHYRVTIHNGKNLLFTYIWIFRHLAWAVGSYSSGPSAARVVGIKSMGGFTIVNGHTVN